MHVLTLYIGNSFQFFLFFTQKNSCRCEDHHICLGFNLKQDRDYLSFQK